MRGKIRLHLAIIIFLFAMISISAKSSPTLKEADRREREIFEKVSYTSIQISYGETLEDIASRYNTSEMSGEEYIERLRELNNLMGSELRPGCYLSVIIFSP